MEETQVSDGRCGAGISGALWSVLDGLGTDVTAKPTPSPREARQGKGPKTPTVGVANPHPGRFACPADT